MRGSIRKWVVLGAVASASLLLPGCENRGQGVEVPGQPDSRELEPATGGAGQPDSVDPLELDNQPSLNEPAGAAEPRGTGGAGATDAGTGGAGYNVPQETGTQGQGVTGGSDEGELLNTDTESGGIRSPDMPEMNPKSGEERFKK